MKNLISGITKMSAVILVTGTVLLLFTGCPYQSGYPLGKEENSSVDQALCGTWVRPNENNKAFNDTVIILPFNGHEYYIEVHDRGKGLPVTGRGRGFITVIDAEKFLNINDLDHPGTFYFAVFRRDLQTLTLQFASDGFIKQKFSSEKEINTYFAANCHKPGFLEGNDVYMQVPVKK